jgi:hypothetical protein
MKCCDLRENKSFFTEGIFLSNFWSNKFFKNSFILLNNPNQEFVAKKYQKKISFPFFHNLQKKSQIA